MILDMYETVEVVLVVAPASSQKQARSTWPFQMRYHRSRCNLYHMKQFSYTLASITYTSSSCMHIVLPSQTFGFFGFGSELEGSRVVW